VGALGGGVALWSSMLHHTHVKVVPHGFIRYTWGQISIKKPVDQPVRILLQVIFQKIVFPKVFSHGFYLHQRDSLKED
jgi:hypothetical protein